MIPNQMDLDGSDLSGKFIDITISDWFVALVNRKCAKHRQIEILKDHSNQF